MKVLLVILFVVMVTLQYRLWVGEGSYADVRRLQAAIDEQRAENDALELRNQELEAEVRDLKQGLEAVEERARRDLGMLREGETFYQVTDQ